MKLQTSIQPRRTGKVEVFGQDRQTYTFAPGPDGVLECEIEDVPTLKMLLRTQNFHPANPDDYEDALALARPDPVPGEDLDDGDGIDPALKSDADLDLDDDEGDMDAPLIEGGATAAATSLAASNKFETVIEIGGKQYPLAEIVALAHAASGLTIEGWNALPEDERDDLIADQVEAMEAAEALPVEAETPPQVAPDRAAKANAAVRKKRAQAA